MRKLSWFAGLLAFTIGHAQAMPAGGRAAMSPDGGTSSRMAHMFGANQSFSATAVTTMEETAGGKAHTMEMNMAVLAGKVRTEIDMSKSSMAKESAQAQAQMAAMGMGKMIMIVRPDKGVSYMVYPGLKAYCETALSDASASSKAQPKIEKKELGRETIDGHPCIKQQLTITEESGRVYEGMMWEATDLNGLPVQVQMVVDSGTVTTLFKNLKTDKPDASLFEPPAGYQRHASMQAMMMATMMQKMQPQ